ncbi:MAG TPA: hypothetical protein VLT33_26885 [Labilithrix sp.]|nr:hypothetical protein [Labilithrix sp.]
MAISPAWAHALLPRSVSADGIGLGIAVNPGGRAANGRLAFALVGALYGPFSSEARRQTVAFPLNERLGHLSLEGRYAVLKRSSFELSPVAGVGTVATRPVSVIDPEYRRFDYGMRLAMTLGAVLHVRVASHVFLGIEVRDLVYVEQLETREVSPTQRADPSTWFGSKPLTNMVEGRVGLTFVLGGAS